MRYFAMITNWYLPKNKLHEAILEMAQAMDRKVLESKGEAEIYRNEFKRRVEQLQSEHPRCKQVHLRTKSYVQTGIKSAGQPEDLATGVHSVVEIDIYQEFQPKPSKS